MPQLIDRNDRPELTIGAQRVTVQDYLRVVRDRWKIIALAVLLGIVGALIAFVVRPAEYTASTSLYVSAQVGDNPQQAYQGAQLSEQRVKSYNELVTGDRVLSETIRRLGLNQTSGELASHITASSAVDSVIINITVSDESPAAAAAIANTVGVVTTEVVADLERPAEPGGTPPVAVRMVQPAPVPMQPSSTGMWTVLALGLFAGLLVGLGAALVRNVLDTSVKSLNHLSAASGAPNIGAIVFDPKMPERPLIVHDDPQSPRSEAFRQLRTNLQFIDVDSPRKVILVTSSVPSEGKTTTVANLAIALAATNERVLVIEADMRRPTLSALLDLDHAVGLSQVLAGKLRLSRAVQPWRGGSFDVLPSGRTPPNPSELLGSNQMSALINEARTSYDFILIDSPPLLPVTDAAAVAPVTDGAVLACRFGKTSRQQIENACAALHAVSAPLLGTILTLVPARKSPSNFGYGAYQDQDPQYPAPVRGAQTVASSHERPHPEIATPDSAATQELSARRQTGRRRA